MMNWFFPALAIFTRMTAYGLVLGGFAGSLALLTIQMTFAFEYQYDIQPNFIFTFLIVGGLVGSMLGVISGLLSGTSMAIASSLFFRVVHKPRFYKLCMGIITLITTGCFLAMASNVVLHLSSPTDYIYGINAWLSVLIMSVVIAIYVSQITARNYIYEISLYQEKTKV